MSNESFPRTLEYTVNRTIMFTSITTYIVAFVLVSSLGIYCGELCFSLNCSCFDLNAHHKRYINAFQFCFREFPFFLKNRISFCWHKLNDTNVSIVWLIHLSQSHDWCICLNLTIVTFVSISRLIQMSQSHDWYKCLNRTIDANVSVAWLIHLYIAILLTLTLRYM